MKDHHRPACTDSISKTKLKVETSVSVCDTIFMKNNFSEKEYAKKNPKKAKKIKSAVKQGLKEYGSALKRLALS